MRKPADWRASTYSAAQGNCVEVGAADSTVLVRDTKNRAAGTLRVSPSAWHRFAAALKTTTLPG